MSAQHDVASSCFVNVANSSNPSQHQFTLFASLIKGLITLPWCISKYELRQAACLGRTASLSVPMRSRIVCSSTLER
jgi:hypothetical protein